MSGIGQYALLKSTRVRQVIAFPVTSGIFHWDRELWAIRTVTGARIGLVRP